MQNCSKKNSSDILKTAKALLHKKKICRNIHEERCGQTDLIKVGIRIRPIESQNSDGKLAVSSYRTWRVSSESNSIFQTDGGNEPVLEKTAGTHFRFDRTFSEKSKTSDVYDGIVKEVVDNIVSGLNGTVFAYGQTNSGKTFTMQGDTNARSKGIIQLAAHDIFKHIENDPTRDFLVRTSFLEIYNEQVRDLLSCENAKPKTLAVREDSRRGVFVNCIEHVVTDYATLLGTLYSGEKNRVVASTGMNIRSSRSHTIFRITVESSETNSNRAVLVSTLNLVDLAGSESVRHTGATGQRQKEGGKINQSLLTLAQVIQSLGKKKHGHINYRDSKLTRILQPSLSGNSRTVMICCISPSRLYVEETRSTLKFASRAKLVRTKARKNEINDDQAMIKRLQVELKEARHLLQISRKKLKERDDDKVGQNYSKALSSIAIYERKIKSLQSFILRGGVTLSNITSLSQKKEWHLISTSQLLSASSNCPTSPLHSKHRLNHMSKSPQKLSLDCTRDDSNASFSNLSHTSEKENEAPGFYNETSFEKEFDYVGENLPCKEHTAEVSFFKQALSLKKEQILSFKSKLAQSDCMKKELNASCVEKDRTILNLEQSLLTSKANEEKLRLENERLKCQLDLLKAKMKIIEDAEENEIWLKLILQAPKVPCPRPLKDNCFPLL